MGQTAPAAAGRIGKRRLIGLLIVAACLAALVWTVLELGPRRVVAVALRADPLWLGLSFVPLAGRFLIWGVKWNRILRRRARVPYLASLRVLIAGSFVNLTTPTAKLAGGVLRAALLHKRYGWGLAASYGRAFADQATNALGTLSLYGLLAVAAYFFAPQLGGRGSLLVSGLTVLALIALGVGLRGWAWRQAQQPRVGRLIERWTPSRFGEPGDAGNSGGAIRSVLYPLLGERTARATLLPDVALAALSFSTLCIANAMVLKALGAEADLWVVALVVVLGYFAGVLVGVWGGIGVTEAALTGLYIQVGIPAGVATAGALLHRACFYLVILGCGGLALLREGRLRS